MGTATLMVLWGKPEDRNAFDSDYLGTHLPLARDLPGLVGLRTRTLRSKHFSRCAELEFDDETALRAALASPAGQAVTADVQRLEQAHATTSTSHIARDEAISSDDGGEE